MKLLIVDDEVQIIHGILNGIQWELLDFEETLTAKSYEQAKAVFQSHQIDVLLSDIEMTDKSGLDLIAWVNQAYPDTVCIILSCHDEFDYARRAVSLKCLDYVLKPIPYEILTEVLRRAGETVHREQNLLRLENYGKAYVKQLSDTIPAEAAEGLLDKAVTYLKEHLFEEVSVETLAKTVHISPRHLGRLFKKQYDKSVSEYILEQRMLVAGNLLREKNLSVTMVSDKVGYGNYSYFIKIFKKFYGMTPREYQIIHQKHQ